MGFFQGTQKYAKLQTTHRLLTDPLRHHNCMFRGGWFLPQVGTFRGLRAQLCRAPASFSVPVVTQLVDKCCLHAALLSNIIAQSQATQSSISSCNLRFCSSSQHLLATAEIISKKHYPTLFFVETFRSFLLRNVGHVGHISVICLTFILKLPVTAYCVFRYVFSL